MTGREIIPTQSAYLELKAERVGMHEGYRFLDEKRLILAAEILAGLREYEQAMASWREGQADALAALRAALGRHGIEELSVYPPLESPECALAGAARSVLGVRIEDWPTEAAAVFEPSPGTTAVNQSPEAEECRTAFARLLPIAARLACLTGNLERLRVEYVRTARRARALEDVLLPEIDDSLRAIDTALEELEREEAVRVRRAAGPSQAQ